MKIFKSALEDIEIKDVSLTEIVFQGLENRQDDVVITDGVTGEELTAGQLMKNIKSLAGGLTENGRGHGHTVAIMAPNCPEYATLIHGVAWCGGTFTTINPTYTAHEVRHQLNDAGAGTLVVVPALVPLAKEAIEGTGVTRIVSIGEADGAMPLADLMGPEMPNQFPVDLDEHVVALPYSSGTTGLPKGVMLTHRGLAVNIDQVAQFNYVQPGDSTPAFLPFFHIFGLAIVINVVLNQGGRYITMPRFDLEMYLRIIQEHKPRVLWMVPPVALALAKHPMVDEFDVSSVKQIFSAAAPMGPELSDAVAARMGCACSQGYGMTELSPVSHVTPLESPKTGSCGVTLSNTQCRIVDSETGEDMDVDQLGELWIKGPQVMKGYLNNPEATANTIDSDGWMKTGDVASFDADGHMYIRDRLKELIKYKGFQVAPAEVEAILIDSPMIADAAVIGRPDDEAGEVPVAFVVAAPDQSPTLEQIQAHVAEHLSHYKQIHQVTFVDEIPKSPSGKILRRFLRERTA